MVLGKRNISKDKADYKGDVEVGVAEVDNKSVPRQESSVHLHSPLIHHVLPFDRTARA
jgi:hypothetical protein